MVCTYVHTLMHKKLGNYVHTYMFTYVMCYSHNSNHVQLWVQILEKTNEEVVDYQPALVEEDQFTSTGGIYVLSKVRRTIKKSCKPCTYVTLLVSP